MKEVKIRRVSEGLFELETPTWCWNIHLYIAEGLRQIVAGGDLPFHYYRRFSLFHDVFMVTTIPRDRLKDWLAK